MKNNTISAKKVDFICFKHKKQQNLRIWQDYSNAKRAFETKSKSPPVLLKRIKTAFNPVFPDCFSMDWNTFPIFSSSDKPRLCWG